MVRREYDDYEPGFREDYEELYEDTEYGYEHYERAYRYGYDLATRHGANRWEDYEEQARREWEQRGQGPWEDFKDAVRHAWEEVTGEEQQ